MATWRKVLVSGSSAHISTLEVGTAGTIAGTITNRSKVSDSHLSGSFTGSFVGDGSNLDGVTTVFPTTAELGSLDSTKIYVNDGSNKFVSGSQLATYVFGEAATGGDVEIANTGAGTIAADAVTNAKLANITRGSVKVGGTANAPTDLDAKTSGQILVGDGTDIVSVAVSGDATLSSAGAITIAADSVENSMLANMTQGTIKVGGGSDAPTDLDAKTDGQILVGDGTDINSVAISGDITLANDGTVAIAANAVALATDTTGDFVQNITAGTGITSTGATSGENIAHSLSVDAAQTGITSVLAADLKLGEDAQTLIDFETANEIHFDVNNVELVNMNGSTVSGSAISTASFGTYLGDGSQLSGINPEIDGLDALDAAPHATQDHFLVSDNGTEKKITTTNVAKGVFALVTGGDFTIDANGAGTIAANSVALATDTTGDFVQNITGGTGITSTGATSGENIAHSLSVDAAQTGITSVKHNSLVIGGNTQNNTIDFGTDDVILFDTDNTERMRVDAAGVDITGALTVSSNATISGDLTVNGTTTTISSTNTAIADRFIIIASGSAASNTDGGIVVQEGANEGTGSAFYHDTDSNRWSVAKAVVAKATAVTPLEHVVTVKLLGDNDAPVDGDKEYGDGEMAINNDGSIWIYS